MLAVIIKEQRLSASLPLIIAGTWADRVYVAPVTLLLGVLGWVAINLAGRCLENSGADALGEASILIAP